jgi:hypothetical protein
MTTFAPSLRGCLICDEYDYASESYTQIQKQAEIIPIELKFKV